MKIKSRIMIVDGDAVVCEIYGDFLKQNGFEVWIASNVDIALELVKTEEPDLILTDVKLPYRTGFELYETLKMFYPNTPVVFMTSDDIDPQIIDNLKKYGRKWFTKLIKLDEMLEIIRGELSTSQTG